MSLKFNPFRPYNLIHPGMFRGRTQELLGIEKALYQTKFKNPQHILIQGERGIGKSSLMLYVDHLANGRIPFIQDSSFKASFLVVDIELSAEMTAKDIIITLAKKFREQMDKNEYLKKNAKKTWDFISRWEVLGVKYNSESSPQEAFNLLDQFSESLAGFISEAALSDFSGQGSDGVIILIDEADKAEASAGLGQIVKLLIEKTTRLGCDKLAIVMAGLPIVMDKLKESHPSSPRLFEIQTLGPLSKDDSASVIEACLKEANQNNAIKTEIDNEAIIELCELSEGYPHFIQQFGFSAFEADKDNKISADDVKEGAYGKNGALEQLGQKFFQNLFFSQIGSEDYRTVLRVMAEHADKWVSRSEIKSDSGLKDHTIANALQALKNKNIILVNDSQKGSYRLPTKSFAAWIKVLSKAPTSISLFDNLI